MSGWVGRLRLFAASVTVAGALILNRADAAAAAPFLDPCDCEEATTFMQQAIEDCESMGGPPYFCAYDFSCDKREIGAGYWEYYTNWVCDLSGNDGNDVCTYSPFGPGPYC